MKIVVFAGGVGTRLWPLSRKNTPKQFGKIIGDKSTLQQTVERLYPEFNPTDIYISTGIRYKSIVTKQLPEILEKNFIFEPEMRDVGPAIGLASFILKKDYPDEPMAILWSDHLVKNIDAFKSVLVSAKSIIEEKRGDFVFIAQKPRFANQNIGWIELGKKISSSGKEELYWFKKLRYRPTIKEVSAFFKDEHFAWNLGYFVTTPRFIVSLFKQFVPAMYDDLVQIENAWNTEKFEETLNNIYPRLEKISFDNAILEKLTAENIFVLSSDIGWSDVGAWEALKEALSSNENENITRGKVMLEDSKDSLVFNYTDQLTVGIDLNEFLVINTGDIVLVCPKTSVPKIKKLVEGLSGTPHEHLA